MKKDKLEDIKTKDWLMRLFHDVHLGKKLGHDAIYEILNWHKKEMLEIIDGDYGYLEYTGELRAEQRKKVEEKYG